MNNENTDILTIYTNWSSCFNDLILIFFRFLLRISLKEEIATKPKESDRFVYEMEKDKGELASHMIIAYVFASKTLIFDQYCFLLAK